MDSPNLLQSLIGNGHLGQTTAGATGTSDFGVVKGFGRVDFVQGNDYACKCQMFIPPALKYSDLVSGARAYYGSAYGPGDQ